MVIRAQKKIFSNTLHAQTKLDRKRTVPFNSREPVKMEIYVK
jgi:hypothetical protein